MCFESSKLDAQAAEFFYILARIAIRSGRNTIRKVQARSFAKTICNGYI